MINDEIKNELTLRNERIIDIVKNKINEACPGAVDLIGIAGSFCSRDIHEKSDLDLVIVINDDAAKVLDVCFILEDVGFDIYTCKWDRFEEMSNYSNPYVTKLFDLDIVYSRDESVIEKYNNFQKRLLANMSDVNSINKNVETYFSEVLNDYDVLVSSNNIKEMYSKYARIINTIEYIIYMINKSYVKLGIKRIQEEIQNFKELPSEFMKTYLSCTDFKSIDDLKNKCASLVNSMKAYLEGKGIKILRTRTYEEKSKPKKEIQSDDITGTYEEIFSNWYNKMVLACNINNQYLSFMTMASCQEFYNEMYQEYDIPLTQVIDKYNSRDLDENVKAFVNAMNEWKGLYDWFDKKILKFDSLDELEQYYEIDKEMKL